MVPDKLLTKLFEFFQISLPIVKIMSDEHFCSHLYIQKIWLTIYKELPIFLNCGLNFSKLCFKFIVLFASFTNSLNFCGWTLPEKMFIPY